MLNDVYWCLNYPDSTFRSPSPSVLSTERQSKLVSKTASDTQGIPINLVLRLDENGITFVKMADVVRLMVFLSGIRNGCNIFIG